MVAKTLSHLPTALSVIRVSHTGGHPSFSWFFLTPSPSKQVTLQWGALLNQKWTSSPLKNEALFWEVIPRKKIQISKTAINIFYLLGCHTVNFWPLSRGQPHSLDVDLCTFVNFRIEDQREPRNSFWEPPSMLPPCIDESSNERTYPINDVREFMLSQTRNPETSDKELFAS